MTPESAEADRCATAIVLNYDGRELLDVIMPSLAAQRWNGELRTIVLDNGSRDDSVAHVRQRWPHAEVLELFENVGVAAALNRGLELAGTDYVALLNNDLELEPDWLELLVATLERHPEAASATGKMLSFDDRTVFDGAGDLMRWSAAATHRGVGETDTGQYDAAEPVFSPCAGAAVYRRSVFVEIGGFDEDFFAYLEDIDWGLRAQLAGYSARYEPAAVAYHMGGATTRRRQEFYNTLQRRNQILIVVKDYPVDALLPHFPKVLLHQAGWLVAAARNGQLGSQLRAIGDALRLTPLMLRKRRSVQRLRRASLAQLDAVMTPEPYAGQGVSARLRSISSEIAPLLRRRSG